MVNLPLPAAPPTSRPGSLSGDIWTFVPLYALGLTLDELLGHVPDELLIREIERRTLAPEVDCGIHFRLPPGRPEIVTVETSYDTLECDVPPDWDVFNAMLPLVALGDECGEFAHAEHVWQVDEYMDRAGAARKLPPGHRARSLELMATPLPHCRLRERAVATADEAAAFFAASAAAAARARFLFGAVGGSGGSLDPKEANRLAAALLGIEVDLGAGRLVTARDVETALLVSYAHRTPAAVESYVRERLPRVNAEKAAAWGGGDLAGAVWSRDLEVALQGSGRLRRWLASKDDGRVAAAA